MVNTKGPRTQSRINHRRGKPLRPGRGCSESSSTAEKKRQSRQSGKYWELRKFNRGQKKTSTTRIKAMSSHHNSILGLGKEGASGKKKKVLEGEEEKANRDSPIATLHREFRGERE